MVITSLKPEELLTFSIGLINNKNEPDYKQGIPYRYHYPRAIDSAAGTTLQGEVLDSLRRR